MAKVKYKKIPDSLQKMTKPSESGVEKRSSLGGTISVREHYEIDIERLIPFHNQARKNFNEEEIKKLSDSIVKHGLRQPLTVIKSEVSAEKYEVISGERRLRAAMGAGMKKIPCIIISDYNLADEIAVVENIMRQDLHPIELAQAFQHLLNSVEGKTSQSSTAAKIGVDYKVFNNTLQYLNIPANVQKALMEKNIRDRDFLRKILKSSNPEKLLEQKTSPKNKEDKEKSLSVLRVVKKGGNFIFQSNGLKKLNKQELTDLKYKIEELLK